MARRPLYKRSGYNFLQMLCRLTAILLLRVRGIDRENVPVQGGALVCSNHQSFFDPVLVGVVFNRRLNYLARKSLFRFAPFRWLIEFLDAIPIERDGFGIGGIKETLKRLKAGEMVLIFPEGTRTRDGSISALKPGFISLARRSKTPLLPVAMDGAYDAWPRNAKLPRPSKVVVCVGEPIDQEQIQQLDDDQLIQELDRRIHGCYAKAKAARGR